MIKGADPAEAPKDVMLDDDTTTDGPDSGSDTGGTDGDTRTVTATYNPTGGAF